MRTHGPGRGSRYNVSLSGVTFATIPSGTTIDKNGLTTPAIDTGYGTAVKWVFGTADNENNGPDQAMVNTSVTNVLRIATGLTSVVGFYGSLLIDITACSKTIGSTGVTPIWTWYASGGGVTVLSFSCLEAGSPSPATVFTNGVSLQYIAFGT